MGKIINIAKKIKENETEISILFIGNGIKLLYNKEFIESINFAKLYSLDGNDKNVGKAIEIIDYSGWLNLIEICKNNINWN